MHSDQPEMSRRQWGREPAGVAEGCGTAAVVAGAEGEGVEVLREGGWTGAYPVTALQLPHTKAS